MARVKRPVPRRDRPIRSWSAALGPDAEAPRRRSRKAAEKAADKAPAEEDPIVGGVVTGGRVVDEWIRQAQQAARLMGGGASASAWPDAGGRMFRAASDLTAAWLSALTGPLQRPGAWAAPAGSPWPSEPVAADRPTAAPSDPRTAPDDGNGHRAQGVSSSQRVRFEVASRRPIEVILDLHRNGVERFRVLALRHEDDGEVPRIQSPELSHGDDERLRLRVSVSDDQPAGTYHAVILDAAADCAVGTVTLRIAE